MTNKKLLKFINPALRKVQPYQPGLQKGNCIKLNTNENPYSYPQDIIQRVTSDFPFFLANKFRLYPEPHSQELKMQIAEYFSIDSQAILIGNGSDDLLSIIFRTLFGNDSQQKLEAQIVTSFPTYNYYQVLAQVLDISYQQIPLLANWQVDFPAFSETSAKLKVLTLPNSPTGLSEKRSNLYEFIRSQKESLVLIDATYDPFAQDCLVPAIFKEKFPHLLVCGSFSKAYSLAGIRVGWLVADPQLILEFNKVRDPYNVNFLAQKLATEALRNNLIFKKRIEQIRDDREWLGRQLFALDFQVLPSQANFIFARVPHVGQSGMSARNLHDYLQASNILVRYFENPPCQDYMRISIGKREDLQQLLDSIKKWLALNQV